MKINLEQFRREADELLNNSLFKAYHPVGSEHVCDRHIHATDKELWARLKKIPFSWDEPVVMSRFYEGTSVEDVLKMIHDTLLANEEEIINHLSHKAATDAFVLDFDFPIGEGMAKGADRNKLISLSRMRISVGPSNIDGRIFEIISAYPTANLDEIDEVWDAIEEWQEKANH